MHLNIYIDRLAEGAAKGTARGTKKRPHKAQRHNQRSSKRNEMEPTRALLLKETQAKKWEWERHGVPESLDGHA